MFWLHPHKGAVMHPAVPPLAGMSRLHSHE